MYILFSQHTTLKRSTIRTNLHAFRIQSPTGLGIVIKLQGLLFPVPYAQLKISADTATLVQKLVFLTPIKVF